LIVNPVTGDPVAWTVNLSLAPVPSFWSLILKVTLPGLIDLAFAWFSPSVL
jgi:hypothetical protein